MGEAREQGHVVCDVTVQPFRMAAMWPPGPHQLYSPVFCGMPGDRATLVVALFIAGPSWGKSAGVEDAAMDTRV